MALCARHSCSVGAGPRFWALLARTRPVRPSWWHISKRLWASLSPQKQEGAGGRRRRVPPCQGQPALCSRGAPSTAGGPALESPGAWPGSARGARSQVLLGTRPRLHVSGEHQPRHWDREPGPGLAGMEVGWDDSYSSSSAAATSLTWVCCARLPTRRSPSLGFLHPGPCPCTAGV